MFYIIEFRSQSFDRKDNNSSYSFQDSPGPLNNSNYSSGSYSEKRITRDYLVDFNDVPRLIGKGGGNIKQIQKDNDVQIKVSNDRHKQWIDLTIIGSNEQAINNTFIHIKNLIGNIKEKHESNQTQSFFQSGSFSIIQSLVLFILSIIFLK